MAETGQLVRWAMPGFTSVALATMFLWASDASILGSIGPHLLTSGDNATVNIFGGIVGLIAFVTALGFVLSTIHHLLLNSFYPSWFAPDLREAIWAAKLTVCDYQGRPIEPCEMTPAGAWVTVNVAWHSNKGVGGERVREAEWRSSSIFELVHGAGATFVGSVVAAIAAAIISDATQLSLVVSGFAILFLAINYLAIAKRAEAVTGGLLISLARGFDEGVVWVARNRVTPSRIKTGSLRLLNWLWQEIFRY